MSDTDTTEQVSDEAVKESRQRVEELREELARINIDLMANEASRNNEVRKDRLDREAQSLENQLEEARRRLAVSRNEGTDDNMPAESANKPEWEEYAASVGVSTDGKTKEDIISDVRTHLGSATMPTPAVDEANVNTETGEVNPEEVRELTSYDSEDFSDEERE